MKTHGNCNWLILAVLPAVMLSCTAMALEITADYRIVVPDCTAKGVQPHLKRAAEELANDICEATGMRLSVVLAGERKAGEKAICIGFEFAETAGLAPNDHPLTGLENVVAEKDGNVYLFGRDRVGLNVPGAEKSWYSCVLPSVKAVCNFMERELGVAFLAPGRTGRDVPKAAALVVVDGTFRREKPTQVAGTGRYHEMMTDIANGIYGSGPMRNYGGHTYPKAVPFATYRAAHPEYFPMVNGVRVSQNGVNALCISNPDVARLLIEELVRTFDSGAEIVQLGQNDGNDRCFCPACEAYGGPSADTWGEKLWLFHRHIAERLQALRPDKTAQIISYGATANPPRTFREFPSNVMIEMMRDNEEAFASWAKYVVPRGFSNYVYLWGTYNHPGHTAKCCVPQMADCARRYLTGGVMCVYRCGYGELYGTEGPAYWVFNRLLQDPKRNEYDEFDGYVARAYGPAAAPMHDFHELLDLRVRGFVRMYEGWEKHDGTSDRHPVISPHAAEVIAYMYPPDVLAKLEKKLAAAERTAGLTEKQRARLRLVRLEFDYARNLATTIQLYQAYQLSPSRVSFEAVAKCLRERKAMLDGYYDEKGRMKPIPGWPEMRPFQRHSRRDIQFNGHLRARLAAPFGWDADDMLAKNILPGASAMNLVVRPAASKPTLDDFEKGSWATAEWQELRGMQLETCSQTGAFKVLYDDENLYVAIKVSLAAERTFPETGRDSTCFRTDCIEMLIDPTGARDRIYHLIWNPVANSFHDSAQGLFEDPLDPRYADDWAGWNGDWTYANRREGDTWYTLLTLPFETVGARKPAKDETWGLNVGRAHYPPGSVGNRQVECQLWSPNFENRNFTNPDAMGIVRFE